MRVHALAALQCEEEALPCGVTASSSNTKTSSIFRRRGGAIYLITYIQNSLLHAPRTFTIRLSAPNTTRYEPLIFGLTSPLTLNCSHHNRNRTFRLLQYLLFCFIHSTNSGTCCSVCRAWLATMLAYYSNPSQLCVWFNGTLALPFGLSLVICAECAMYTLITIGSVNTTVQSASKDQVVMEFFGQSVHVTLPAFSAVRFFPTPLRGVVKSSYWN